MAYFRGFFYMFEQPATLKKNWPNVSVSLLLVTINILFITVKVKLILLDPITRSEVYYI